MARWHKVHDNPVTTASQAPLRCPFYEVYEHIGHDSGHCPSCGGFFSEGFLEALRRLTELPDFSPASLVGASADTATWRYFESGMTEEELTRFAPVLREADRIRAQVS